MMKYKMAPFAASELEMRAEVTAVGDEDYALLAAYNKDHLVVFCPEMLNTLANQACDLANGIDTDLEAKLIPSDDRKASRAACIGLWNLANRLRKVAP